VIAARCSAAVGGAASTQRVRPEPLIDAGGRLLLGNFALELGKSVRRRRHNRSCGMLDATELTPDAKLSPKAAAAGRLEALDTCSSWMSLDTAVVVMVPREGRTKSGHERVDPDDLPPRRFRPPDPGL
jgi:hypothetical protein